MESSNTKSWKSPTSEKSSRRLYLGREALLATSTRELVEFYWANRKQFSGSYKGFPKEVAYKNIT